MALMASPAGEVLRIPPGGVAPMLALGWWVLSEEVPQQAPPRPTRRSKVSQTKATEGR